MKQESLAAELGVSQQAVSKMEQSESMEDEALERVAKALGVTAEAVRNYSDEAVISYVNNFSDHSINQGPIGSGNTCNFNPLDKLVEAYEENRKLYERLLASEREKTELLKGRNA